ncbi:hypothetical protein [Salinicola sp. CR57]|uniref:hypothetical protein n=1 Tax=Salinicola sp. CR57 TaxID=1949086 RepID=UPI000DA1F6FB|nr:hypothetical protein [Salinicola sp. CR57]
MSKSYDERCQEVALLRDQLSEALDKGKRLELKLEASNAMLREALDLGEALNGRCRRLAADNAQLKRVTA